jgi:hypothetical protein
MQILFVEKMGPDNRKVPRCFMLEIWFFQCLDAVFGNWLGSFEKLFVFVATAECWGSLPFGIVFGCIYYDCSMGVVYISRVLAQSFPSLLKCHFYTFFYDFHSKLRKNPQIVV